MSTVQPLATPTPLKGVNLGGWLVLERWMTPTLFEGTNAHDEHSFMKTPDAAEKLRSHRDTFITEKDFAWLQANGITAIRIPVGYWLLDGDAPYLAGSAYLDWAFDMALKYSLKVVVDIHGLPGSQNGYDHSGKEGEARWFAEQHHRTKSLDVLQRFSERYKDRNVLWGLQLINEPRLDPSRLFTLLGFYKQAYEILATTLPKECKIIVSDGFIPRTVSVFLPRAMHRVVLDVHLYHMATPLAKFFSLSWFFKKTQRRSGFIKRLSRKHPVIIGEWSAVLRHTTTQKMSREEEAKAVKEYLALQLAAYESAAGWFYWSYKTEKPGVWSYRTMVEEGNIAIT